MSFQDRSMNGGGLPQIANFLDSIYRKGLFFKYGVQPPRIIIVDPEINHSKAGISKNLMEFIQLISYRQ